MEVRRESTPERAEHLLSLLPDRSLNEGLRRKWDSSPGRGSAAKWADIDAVAKSGASGRHLDTRALLEAKQDVVLEYTYPRLDIEVSKKLNHLLKSPFVVHPGTGRVCVPIDASSPASIEAFDAPAMPTTRAPILARSTRSTSWPASSSTTTRWRRRRRR